VVMSYFDPSARLHTALASLIRPDRILLHCKIMLVSRGEVQGQFESQLSKIANLPYNLKEQQETDTPKREKSPFPCGSSDYGYLIFQKWV